MEKKPPSGEVKRSSSWLSKSLAFLSTNEYVQKGAEFAKVAQQFIQPGEDDDMPYKVLLNQIKRAKGAIHLDATKLSTALLSIIGSQYLFNQPLGGKKANVDPQWIVYAKLSHAAYSHTRADLEKHLAPLNLPVIHFEQGMPGLEIQFFITKQEQRGEQVWIIAVRGTATSSDVMIDLQCGNLPLENGQAHQGILQTAKGLLPKIEQVLEKHGNMDRDKIIFTGHSLGGGTSAILTTLFRRKQKNAYKDATCFVFAPAACISGHPEINQGITSFVFEDDLVPRLSLASIEKLFQKLCDNMNATQNTEAFYTRVLGGLLTDLYNSSNPQTNINDLSTPGCNIYHIWTRKQEQTGIYVAEKKFFSLIIPSKTCVKNHRLHAYIEALENISK